MPSILSVIGYHGGGTPESILARKAGDISRSGITFWAYRSRLCQPLTVHLMAKNRDDIWCYFVESATKGSARPTTKDISATRYSIDKKTWMDLPSGIGPVTGCVNSGCYAMVFDTVEMGTKEIDVWECRCFHDHTSPVQFSLGCSTVCVEEAPDCQPGMKSRFRKSVARAKLKAPYAVYLR
jgi:hypothetical protein